MEAKLSDSGANNIFTPDLALKYSKTIFVSWRALIINNLEFSVEVIFKHIVLIFRCGVSANNADVIEFCFEADCGYSFVHRRERRDKVQKFLTNHNMTVVIHITRF